MSNAIKPIKLFHFYQIKQLSDIVNKVSFVKFLKNYFPKEIMNIYPLFLWHMFNAKVVTF